MKIETGLFDNMVLQRGRDNRSNAAFSGVCETVGVLKASVRMRGRTMSGFKARTMGSIRGGRFKGVLRGLPAGGPYDVKLWVEGGSGAKLKSAVARNVLVGDVWVLAGQSNMQGVGWLKDALTPISKVRAFYMRDEWGVAKEPIHNLSEAVDKVHIDLHGGVRPVRSKHAGVGPGVAFGQEMFRRTGVPQGLICCAHGGTSMSQWNPKLKRMGGASLYGAMLRRFRKNGGKVAGILWYQGESEAGSQDTALVYTERMKAFVAAVRRDFHDPRLPIAVVQIASVIRPVGEFQSWNSIQDQQRRLPRHIRNLAVVPAIDLELDDLIHVSGAGMKRLGKRLAQAMLVLKRFPGAGKPPIEFKSFRVEADRNTGMANVIVAFANVMGGLIAPGRPAGFAVADANGEFPEIYKVGLLGDSVMLRCVQTPVDLAGKHLYYGYGLAPYCNITDKADRSLPVFGMIPLGAPLRQTPFVRRFLMSRALPSPGKLFGLEYPADKSGLQLRERVFPADFADIHLDVFSPAEDLLVYYQCSFECDEAMSVEVAVGYDGPFKAWVDKREVFHDPDGTNPATADKARIPCRVKRGCHELLMAMSSNNGRAWGIHLRFLRTDAPRSVRGEKPEFNKLPMPGI